MNELNLERCRCIPKEVPGADWRCLEHLVAQDPAREMYKVAHVLFTACAVLMYDASICTFTMPTSAMQGVLSLGGPNCSLLPWLSHAFSLTRPQVQQHPPSLTCVWGYCAGVTLNCALSKISSMPLTLVSRF